MAPSKDEIARRFGQASRSYAESDGHARGQDLDLLVTLVGAKRDMVVLDVATGAGHTAAALAPLVKEIVAADLSAGMIEEARRLFRARGLDNAKAVLSDVESLAFDSEMFDVVTCRIAPHHFLDPLQALREINRVLKPQGRFVLEDSIAPPDPELDRFLNHLEVVRDPTHVRSYTEQEWRAMLERAGFSIVRSQIYRKSHDVEKWIDRQGPDPQRKKRVLAVFLNAPAPAREYFEITFKNDRAVSYTDDKLLLLTSKGPGRQSP